MAGPLATLLASRQPVILDGAIGTELERRGADTGLPLWSANALLTAIPTLRQIHEDYIEAGADIICTATFRTTHRTFLRAGLPDRSAALTSFAVALAEEARAKFPGRRILIGGSMGPLEDCYRPDLVPPYAELLEEHGVHARRLVEAGVDFLILETIGTAREACAALEAARGTGREVIVSLLCSQQGALYSGEPLQEAVDRLMPLSPAAMSINCVSARSISIALRNLLTALGRFPDEQRPPITVYANVGLPGGEHGGAFTCTVTPEEYAGFAREWRGVSIIGGCCGTTPEHIRALAETFHAA